MPRAGLSPDVVVAEAARFVDDQGAQNLTLAALAKRFGVALPSLYKHVAGLDDLHGRLATTAASELAVEMRRAATGRAGVDALRSVAAAYRTYAAKHSGRYQYLLRAHPGDEAYEAAAGEVLDVVRGVFTGYAIDGDDAVDAARFVRSALHGFVSLEAADGFGIPRSVDRSFDRLVDGLDHALQDWGSPATAG
jgi:AcrR family transcriptional regulator